MRRTALIGLAAALAITLVAPGRAAAQMSITPFVGSSFSGDAPATKLATGFAVTYMGRFAGVEAELGYTPDFYAEEAGTALVGDSNVTSFMGSALIGYGRARVKPYAALGAGLLRSRVTSGSALFDDVSTNSFGFNIGGGVTALLSEHVGLRGDVRYFRSLSDDEPDNNFDLAVGSFDFWRAYGGLTVSF